MNVILINDKKKIDWWTTSMDVETIESIDFATKEDATYLINCKNSDPVLLNDINVFIPAESFKNEGLQENASIYFDLELYPFFQKAKEIIKQVSKPKGVLRLRRTSEQYNELFIISDLFVLSKLLGNPEHIWVKKTRKEVKPNHIIVTVNFGGGTMAHLDYTFYTREYLEFEWSGNHSIIEFNSDEMNPVQPNSYLEQPLAHNIESILEYSHDITEELLEELSTFKTQVLKDVKK